MFVTVLQFYLVYFFIVLLYYFKLMLPRINSGLTLPILCISESCIEIKKIKLDFYFYASLWCLKKFLLRHHKEV